jgi:tetratricopeptide (TPR) repeat protein
MGTVIHSSEFQRVEYFCNNQKRNDAIAFVFSPWGNRMLEGNIWGGEVFLRNGFDVIVFNNSNDDWFQSIPTRVFETINSVITYNQYKMKVGYGSSMGGYASIAFSKLLDLDKAVVISPQFNIGEPFDERWLAESKRINFVYRISEDEVSQKCKFQILYDDKDLDRLHVEMLVKVIPAENVELYKLPYSGHPSTFYLHEIEQTYEIIKECRSGSVNRLNLRADRSRSHTYLSNLSAALNSSRKFKMSLSTIDSAIALNSSRATYHKTRSAVLEKMNLVDESLNSLKIAISLDPENSWYQQVLSRLLAT